MHGIDLQHEWGEDMSVQESTKDWSIHKRYVGRVNTQKHSSVQRDLKNGSDLGLVVFIVKPTVVSKDGVIFNIITSVCKVNESY